MFFNGVLQGEKLKRTILVVPLMPYERLCDEDTSEPNPVVSEGERVGFLRSKLDGLFTRMPLKDTPGKTTKI